MGRFRNSLAGGWTVMENYKKNPQTLTKCGKIEKDFSQK